MLRIKHTKVKSMMWRTVLISIFKIVGSRGMVIKNRDSANKTMVMVVASDNSHSKKSFNAVLNSFCSFFSIFHLSFHGLFIL